MTQAWFQNELSSGFQRLVCLSLDRTPAAEVIEGTLAGWVQALVCARNWSEDRDTRAIREAFARLAAKCESWPSPREFLEHVNALTPTENTYERLPPPTTIPATREERREHLRKLCPDLAK